MLALSLSLAVIQTARLPTLDPGSLKVASRFLLSVLEAKIERRGVVFIPDGDGTKACAIDFQAGTRIPNFDEVKVKDIVGLYTQNSTLTMLAAPETPLPRGFGLRAVNDILATKQGKASFASSSIIEIGGTVENGLSIAVRNSRGPLHAYVLFLLKNDGHLARIVTPDEESAH